MIPDTETWEVVKDDGLTHAAAAAAFLQKGFRTGVGDLSWSEDYFAWKLGAANPAGPGFLTLARTGSEIIGTTTITRKRLLIDGVEVPGAEIGDTYSSPEWRRAGRARAAVDSQPDPDHYLNKSIFGRLVHETTRRAKASGLRWIYGTPNENSHPGYVKRLDYVDLRSPTTRYRARPTSRAVVAAYRLPRWTLAALAPAENLMGALVHQWRGRIKSLRLAPDSPLPATGELDELWSRNRPTSGFALLRDAAYWEHRYLRHPLARYRFLTVRDRDSGRLRGIVVSRRVAADNGRAYGAVVEWMLDPSIGLAGPISETVRSFRDDGIDLFYSYVTDGSEAAGVFQRSLFIPRSPVRVIFAGTQQARALNVKPDEFLFYLGSTDGA